MGIHDWAIKCFTARENNPGARLNAAYSTLPVAEVTPRDYNAIVGKTTILKWWRVKSPGRIAANSVIPYPPGNPDAAFSGETFGDENSPRGSFAYAHCNHRIITSLALSARA